MMKVIYLKKKKYFMAPFYGWDHPFYGYPPLATYDLDKIANSNLGKTTDVWYNMYSTYHQNITSYLAT